jgi:hypothetical protein
VLTLPTEWSLVLWQGLRITGSGCETLEQYRVAWEIHRDDLLEHYIDQIPGSRPFAMYATGELPTPPLIHEPRQHDPRVQIGDRVFHERRCYGDELEHLAAIGVVTGDELAIARRQGLPVSIQGVYRWLSQRPT